MLFLEVPILIFFSSNVCFVYMFSGVILSDYFDKGDVHAFACDFTIGFFAV